MIETDKLAAKAVSAGRIILASPTFPNEEAFECALRPKPLDEHVGQGEIRGQFDIFTTTAKNRSETLGHVLLFGLPGPGKTTPAHTIACEMGADLRQTSGPVLECPGDLAALLTSLETNGVFFTDEIYRLSPVMEGILYPALEDYQVDIMIDEGPTAHSIKLDLQSFTPVGATTRANILIDPLCDRFGTVARLESYMPAELAKIITHSSGLPSTHVVDEGAPEVAKCPRGTPRIANRLLRRVRDFAEVRADDVITREVADAALAMLGADAVGFNLMGRELLKTILHKFNGDPVGIDNLVAAIGEECNTAEDMLEPCLIQQGCLRRTSRGHVATTSVYQHFGLGASKSGPVWDLWDDN